MRYTAENLVVHPNPASQDGLVVEVTPRLAGWEAIHFQSRCLPAGSAWRFSPGPFEMALVVLEGTLDAHTNHGDFMSLGRRESVFAGLPEALYLPPESSLEVTARIDSGFAVAWVASTAPHPARRITPEDVTVELRGGDNASRQINNMISPGFDCERLVVVEVYTPGGNWSSYPPHKHDVHRVDASGRLVQADLEEVYYYKLDKPEGYALQRLYTGADSPLQLAGEGFDAVVVARSDDVVLVPEGYHPVTCPPGYTAYYLNVLAGSAQALTAEDDPAYSWVKGTYKSRDPRLPLYPVNSAQVK